jgi:phosphoribosylformylglycinamidine cyclo-ligase
MSRGAEPNYRSAGVDVAAGQRVVQDISQAVKDTQGPEVLGSLDGFAGLFALSGYREPVLVSGTDGVGTKVELARAAGDLSTIGIDLVAMCVNDVLCHGAHPLFFLDYVAVDSLRGVSVPGIVSGVAQGCRQAGCALIGGETAEMPGVYRPGRFDLAGCAVGVVERSELVDGSALEAGMAVVGLASSGFHSNGFSLLRALFPTVEEPSATGVSSLQRELLEPTRIYAAVVADLRRQLSVAGMAHVTGGGWWENLPRLLGARRGELGLVLDASAVVPPPVFRRLAETALSPAEAYGTFNMGLGFAVALPRSQVDRAIAIAASHDIAAWSIGELCPRSTDEMDLRGVPARLEDLPGGA